MALVESWDGCSLTASGGDYRSGAGLTVVAVDYRWSNGWLSCASRSDVYVDPNISETMFSGNSYGTLAVRSRGSGFELSAWSGECALVTVFVDTC